MKIERDSLIQKFQFCRSKAKGKKVVYPLKLRKAAAGLAGEQSSKSLATDLGVSVASIKAWSKAFAPVISEKDLVPIEINGNPTPQRSVDEIKVRIIAMEASVPSSRLAGTLADIIQGMGASSC